MERKSDMQGGNKTYQNTQDLRPLRVVILRLCTYHLRSFTGKLKKAGLCVLKHTHVPKDVLVFAVP